MTEDESAQDRADMECLVRGQDSALDRLMARHAPRLHSYLLRLLQNDSDAEDLAQETFARVYEHRHRFDPQHPLATWLYAIATNLVRDRYRWRTRHPEAPLDAPVPEGRGSERDGSRGPADLLPDPGPDPTGRAVAGERARAVRQAVAELPEDLRAPLILAEFEERSHQEIGVILECSAKAVEMRLYRARQRLRELLARWLRDAGG